MSYESILRPIAVKLLEENVNYPLTIVYLPLRWCGFAYKLFENILGKAQYYPLGSVLILRGGYLHNIMLHKS